jgi:Pvc16 N-terminal domain
MLRDLDLTLESLLATSLPPELAANIDIRFDAPDNTFKPVSQKKTLDLFLYDVRENRELRSNEPTIERQSNGSIRQARPPVWMDCSYFITAWSGITPDTVANKKLVVEEEHKLLSDVMKVLLRYPILPAAILQEELQNQEPPRTSMLQPSMLQSIAEFWQALGGKPRAALNYMVTISVNVDDPQAAAPIVTDRQVKLRQGTDGR